VTDAQRLVRLLAHATYERVDKPWGTEHMLTLPNDGGIIKVIHVRAHAATSLQHHVVKEEVTYVLESDGVRGGVHVEDQTWMKHVRSGEHVHLKPGTVHRTVGSCLLLEATTPENYDVVRHADDYGRASRG
jgi:mannose-6-phosphate isomerase-like protein (cupin superfamily)